MSDLKAVVSRELTTLALWIDDAEREVSPALDELIGLRERLCSALEDELSGVETTDFGMFSDEGNTAVSRMVAAVVAEAKPDAAGRVLPVEAVCARASAGLKQVVDAGFPEAYDTAVRDAVAARIAGELDFPYESLSFELWR